MFQTTADSKIYSSLIYLRLRDYIHNTPFSSEFTNRPNKLDCFIKQLEGLTSDKHCNLLGQFLSYKENEVFEYTPRWVIEMCVYRWWGINGISMIPKPPGTILKIS
jgi:hypothetical protein